MDLVSFSDWFESEFGEEPDMDDECTSAMMQAYYAGMDAVGEYEAYEGFVEDAMLEELGF